MYLLKSNDTQKHMLFMENTQIIAKIITSEIKEQNLHGFVNLI